MKRILIPMIAGMLVAHTAWAEEQFFGDAEVPTLDGQRHQVTIPRRADPPPRASVSSGSVAGRLARLPECRGAAGHSLVYRVGVPDRSATASGDALELFRADDRGDIRRETSCRPRSDRTEAHRHDPTQYDASPRWDRTPR